MAPIAARTMPTPIPMRTPEREWLLIVCNRFLPVIRTHGTRPIRWSPAELCRGAALLPRRAVHAGRRLGSSQHPASRERRAAALAPAVRPLLDAGEGRVDGPETGR